MINTRQMWVKQAFLILLMAVPCWSYGQCSIAVCNKTGAWDYAYNDGVAPAKSTDELKQLAISRCTAKGGKNCKEFYTIEAKGCWYAFLISTGPDGRFSYKAITGEKTKEEAETVIKQRYIAKGGLNPDGAQITSWYVPGQK